MLPMMEPRNEPMPPMMTMTKASITTVVPMPRKAVTSGAASTPPNAAMAQPMPNTAVRTRSTSVPSACTISEFCDTARIRRPARVRSRNCHTAIRGGDAEPDQEQAVERERLVQDDDDAAQDIRDAGAQRLRTPDQPDDLAQHHGEAEGEQQVGAAVAPSVQVAQEHYSNAMPTPPTTIGARISAGDEAVGEDVRRVADIGAEHEDDAVGEIDDAHDAEDQREAAGDEEQDRRLRERTQALRQMKPRKFMGSRERARADAKRPAGGRAVCMGRHAL